VRTNKGIQIAISLSLLGGLACGATAAADADEGAYELPSVVVEGSPSDLLLSDPVLSQKNGDFAHVGTSGSVLDPLLEQMALPMDDRGSPGAYTSFRGLGRSADDTNVQTLGIPLNGPQGGGFDLSTFPQFLWSGYRFQLSPSAAAFDPSSVSGTLSLVPWTQKALFEKGREQVFQLSELYSSSGLTQVAAGSRYGNAALIA
jgi:hypothetical protein